MLVSPISPPLLDVGLLFLIGPGQTQWSLGLSLARLCFIAGSKQSMDGLR